MRIVQVEDFFYPKAGYQINILSKMWSASGHEVEIITAKKKYMSKTLVDFFSVGDLDQIDEEFSKKHNVKIHRVEAYGLFSSRVLFKKNIINKINEINADIVFVHGNDTLIGIMATLNYKKFKAPLVMDSHMQQIASKNRFSWLFRYIYKKLITPIIKSNNIKIIKTVQLDYVNKFYHIPVQLTPYLGFGSDTTLFKPDHKVRNKIREKYGLTSNSRVFIYAGKINRNKGIDILAKAIKERFVSSCEFAIFIIGSENDSEIENLLSESSNTIIRLGTVDYETLPMYFQASDIAIFPRENSLTFFDAQASGLPVILDDTRINLDRLKHNNGMNFKFEDPVSLKNTITKFLEIDLNQLNLMKNNSINLITNNYDYKAISLKYIELFDEIINGEIY